MNFSPHIDRAFAEHFLTSAQDFNAYGVHLLFNEWWPKAPADAVQKYVDAIEQHPEQGPLAREGWFAPPFCLADLDAYGPGTLGHAYRRFMVDNHLAERLAVGYRELHEDFERSGKLAHMPKVLQYKVLRGFQTHDLHHVVTGYPATPFGEFSLQAFQLAQMDFPYAAMWIAVVTTHMALVDPYMIKPAMDALADGWSFGRQSRSIQFVKFETMLHLPLAQVQATYGLARAGHTSVPTPSVRTPELMRAPENLML